MQEPFLYSRSVRDNIRIGHSGAAEDEIVSAAASSCVHESIEDFDKGYDTLVGERGVTLSGGQRQRLALARAVLRNPPILILDDALSAVDTETEQMILEALRTRHGRSTTLVIAHRLSTLMHADRIIVVEGGRIVQEGTHQSLVGVDGMYRRLWQVQNQLAEDLRQELASDGDMPGTEGEDGS
jgi:ATP-binding cassette subfamily B protein